MERDIAVRTGAAFILIVLVAAVMSLYDPWVDPVEFEVVLPLGFILGLLVIFVWTRNNRVL